MKLIAALVVLAFVGLASAKSISEADLQRVMKALAAYKRAGGPPDGGADPNAAPAEQVPGGEGAPDILEKIRQIEAQAKGAFLMRTKSTFDNVGYVCPPILKFYREHYEEVEEAKQEQGKPKEEKPAEQLKRALERLTRQGGGEGQDKLEQEEKIEGEKLLMSIDWEAVIILCHVYEWVEEGFPLPEEDKAKLEQA